MTKEFEDEMDRIFDEEIADEYTRGRAISDAITIKMELIEETVNDMSPEQEPGLVKVYRALDHMRDLLSILAGIAAHHVEETGMLYEESKLEELLEEDNEKGDTNTS